MPSPEKKRRPDWGKAEWLATMFALVLILLATCVWPFLLERMLKSHLLRKAREEGGFSEPHLNIFATEVDEAGLALTFYANFTQTESGASPNS
jgi:hypothetical protein